MTLEELKTATTKCLMIDYGFTLDEAEESIDKSVSASAEIWNENAVPDDLAEFLALEDSE
jgi:hypothetical protein